MSDAKSAFEREHSGRVREMFAGIASRYDLLNHLLSGNMDKRWRKTAALRMRDALKSREANVLDVACGTGDLAITLFDTTGAQVVGTDFCHPMLEIAQKKCLGSKRAIPFIEGDALNLPFVDNSFDGATIAFGLRNLADVEQGLRELMRVVKPEGTVAVLEFSKPVVPGFRQLFAVYFTRVLPLLGGVVSGSRRAYEYLPDSVSRFPDQEKLASVMKEIGFGEVHYQNLTGGIAALHVGKSA
ncbi:MAG TPA: bifunctional demethylmenaquinone methyltransferase/2-methoxy-6-polyprenyl-1,4-benzoquinol methylase UbiE [Pyrinomonadaceae bacterium]|nr:bifunctional demethylmenaquinone methyltransferase/2-methoxy-6-polyprenyl-1,4-benzoquinol methylase UbiE [Pyrinomonadaceae bacterium]